MAGSAVNLTGMLGQLANSFGEQGTNVSRGLFDPLLDMQKQKALEKYEAEKIANATKVKAEALKGYKDPLEAYHKAVADKDPQAAKAAAQEYATVAQMQGDDKAFDHAQELQGQNHTIVAQQGAVQMGNIEKSLSNPDLDPRARILLENRANSLMENPEVAAAFNSKKQSEVAMKKAEVDLESAQQTVEEKAKRKADATRIDAALGATQAGKAQALQTPNIQDMTEEQINAHFRGKPVEYQEAFRGIQDKAITRYKALESIAPDKKMSEKEFDSYKIKDYKYEQYLTQTAGGYTTANAAVRQMSYAQWAAKETRPAAKNMQKWHLTHADTLLGDSRSVWTNDVDGKADSDRYIIGMALANQIKANSIEDMIEKGALKPEARSQLVEALDGLGIDMAEIRKGAGGDMPEDELVKPEDVPQAAWDYGSQQQKKDMIKEFGAK